MLLENTENIFRRIVDEYGGQDPSRLRRQLCSLMECYQMDIRNAFARITSDFTTETEKLRPLNKSVTQD
jgi:hypothetical protein